MLASRGGSTGSDSHGLNWDSLNFCVKKWRNLLNYDCTKVKTLEGTLFQFTNKT